jgi:RNA polymerase sigma factor (TIGR02999 family)
LRRIARGLLHRERPGHTLQSAALVNEAWLRLTRISEVDCANRTLFLGLCAELMRRILVDYARSRLRLKRGSELCRITLSDAIPHTTNATLVAIDEALCALAAVDERKCRVVEMRYFGGLSVDETAEALGVSAETVKRDWRLARLWLAREMQRTGRGR